MTLYRKKKVEIVVEAAQARRVLQILTHLHVKGYTVLSSVSGRGSRSSRSQLRESSGVLGNLLIIVIAAEELAYRIVEACQPLLADDIGIIYLSDVEVVRDERF